MASWRRAFVLGLLAVCLSVFVRAEDGAELSYFVRTNWQQGECLSVEEVWVDTHGGEHSSTPVTCELIDDVGPTADQVDEQ